MLLPDIFVPYLRDNVSHYFILQVSPKLWVLWYMIMVFLSLSPRGRVYTVPLKLYWLRCLRACVLGRCR